MSKAPFETFSIEFDANTTKLTRSTKETKRSTDELTRSLGKMEIAAKKAGNVDLEGSRKKSFLTTRVSRAFKGRIASGIIGFAGLSTILSSAQSASETGRLADTLGVSVKELDAFGKAAELSGGSATAFSGVVTSLTKELQDLRETGEKSNLYPIFKEMGIAAYDSQGKLRNVFSILKEIGNYLGSVSSEKAFSIKEKLGLDIGTFTLLKKGQFEVDRLINKQYESGVVTEKNVFASEKLNRSVSQLKLSFQKLGIEIATEASPILENLFKKLSKLINKMSENPGTTTGVLSALGGLFAIRTFPILGAMATLALLIEDVVKGGEGLKDIKDFVTTKVDSFLDKEIFSDQFGNKRSIRSFFPQSAAEPTEASKTRIRLLDFQSKSNKELINQFQSPYASSLNGVTPLSTSVYNSLKYGSDSNHMKSGITKDQTFNISVGDVKIESTAQNSEELAKDFSQFLNKQLRKSIIAYDNGLQE